MQTYCIFQGEIYNFIVENSFFPEKESIKLLKEKQNINGKNVLVLVVHAEGFISYIFKNDNLSRISDLVRFKETHLNFNDIVNVFGKRTHNK